MLGKRIDQISCDVTDREFSPICKRQKTKDVNCDELINTVRKYYVTNNYYYGSKFDKGKENSG